MTAGEAVRRAAAALADCSPTARLDAELLVAHAAGVRREDVLLGLARLPVDPAALDPLVDRRTRGEPVAYITGTREFWSLPIRVTPDVLIPRPDSETLLEAALRLRPSPARVLDLGTGSGALLLAALTEYPEAFGVGVDRSPAAARVAAGNAAALGLGHRAAFAVGDWGAPLAGRFDLILCNPPYLAPGEAEPAVAAHEPAAALFAGADGLDAYRALLPALPGLLATGGAAVLEIGWRQADVVCAMAAARGFSVRRWRDMANRPRALSLQQTPLGAAQD